MAEEVADEEETPSITRQLSSAVSLVGSVIAPATVLSAVLFYFGYVTARSEYDYFGVDVDTIGLSTQDYIMRSPQPLLVPLLLLTLLGAAGLAVHRVLRRRVTDPSFRAVPRRLVVGGAIGLGLGVALLVAYPLIGDWPYYPLAAPLVLAASGVVTAYGVAAVGWQARASGPQHRRSPAWAGTLVLVWVTVAASLFWGTATVAQWIGRGLAKEQARELARLPSVIVDSRERLFLPVSAGVVERDLTGAVNGEPFRYRYTNLRLLIHGKDQMFLVPTRWSPSATTVVVPLDNSVRVQFQFRNDPP